MGIHHLFTGRLIVVLLSSFLVAAQTWCGKHYMQGSSVVPPGGLFQDPEQSDVPLLNLQCSPAIKPYLAGEKASIIVDARITSLKVSASINGKTYSLGSVPLNSTGAEFPLPLDSLTPRKEPYTVTCAATLSGSKQSFKASTQLHYLLPPSKGSVTKQDFRTGSLLVKNGSSWDPIFPIGFYTSFDGFLTNVSNVDSIKARGLNVVHPVPTFDNMTAFNESLDRMEELGLWLMYDMRFTYQNATSVIEQVNMIKERPNLLLWYTADEPDGTSDPLNATQVSRSLINDLDGGGYHPVSLVLNCQDYFFADYSLGADILLQDTYPIDINATFSTVWDTPCTPDFGDCGCDNCKGNLEDISTRMDEFKQRLDLLGRGRSTAVWTVPQAFGNESYWPRFPTGDEWLVESVLGINHGALGVIPWDDPTSPDIMVTSSALAAAVPHIVPFLSTPGVSFEAFQEGQIDVGLWTLSGETLLMAANPTASNVSLVLQGVTSGTAREVLNGGANLAIQNNQVILTLGPTGTTGWIFQPANDGVSMAMVQSSGN
ncbi:hypothetical protein K439DRAFT_792186 [Ramaria rubella]|nr:hypothetical protein K439DRAFT_792186 [Ramaria rubella]